MKHRRVRPLAPAALVAVAALTLAACGSSSDGSATPSASGASATGSPAAAADGCPAGTPTSTDYTVGTTGVKVTGDAGKKPEVALGADTAKVSVLTVCDLLPGDGAPVAAGAKITAHYVGIGAASGKQFDSSWDRGEPSTFSLTGVIEGWTKGLPGMKVGGRRLLVIPGAQAYGANPPSGSTIAANEALVFVVDALPTPVPTVGPHVEGTAGVTVTGDAGKAPSVAVSAETAKVSQLTISDITVGNGAEATPGSTVTVQYVGAGGRTGTVFDSTWANGQTAQFDLSQIITGLADGVPGMKVGGRRLIVMPAAQGFGATVPSGLKVEANEPLVFVIDLVSVP